MRPKGRALVFCIASLRLSLAVMDNGAICTPLYLSPCPGFVQSPSAANPAM